MDKPTTPPLRLLERPARARRVAHTAPSAQPQPWWQRWLAWGGRATR